MIDTSDLDRFATKLETSVGPRVEQSWKRKWSGEIVDEWKSEAAVDTGEYRDSIHETEDGAAADADHAAFVEYGTDDTPPQPALGPTINRVSRPAAADLGDRILREF